MGHGSPPSGETLWILVDLQLKLDALRPSLVALGSKSFAPGQVDRLTGEVLQTTELLMTGRGDADSCRAARYRADLIGVGYDLLRIDTESTARGIGGAVRASTNAGLTWVTRALDNTDADPRWPIKDPSEADRYLLSAVDLRDNAMRAAPVANIMKTGVQVASLTSGAISTVQVTRSGLSILARLAAFLRDGGGGRGFLQAGLAGGVGAVRVAASGRTLVLTIEEVVALAKAGVISATALTVYMAASELHHICTDKNWSRSNRVDLGRNASKKTSLRTQGWISTTLRTSSGSKATRGHIRQRTTKPFVPGSDERSKGLRPIRPSTGQRSARNFGNSR